MLGVFCLEVNCDLHDGFDYMQFIALNDQYQTNTKKRKIITMKLFTKYLVQEMNYDNLKIPNVCIRKEKRLPKTLTYLEIKELLTVVSKRPLTPPKKRDQIRDAVIIEVMINLGLRISEVSRMNLHDYDPIEDRLIIHDKNRKERILFLTSKVAQKHIKII